MKSHSTPPAATATQLKRSLKVRHISMIAVGGSIGTGLFVASGSVVASAGAGGAVAAYLLIGIMVYFVMMSLGELAAYMPVSGSFATYGERFVDPGFGFALGWNYWCNGAVTIAVDLVAAQIIMAYWFPSVPGIYWSAGLLALMVGINSASVRGFGETEFWFALIKVVTILAFIVTGLLMIFGILKGGETASWQNILSTKTAFTGGLPAMFGVMMIAGFSFQGVELVGVAAAESENPHKTIPLAIRRVFWRILLFYVIAIVLIGLLLPYNDPSLTKNTLADIATSPFTLIFERAGLAFAAGLMNAVVLTAITSSGNSVMYASVRILHALAQHNLAPKMFAKLSANGIPRNALYATALVAMLCFATALTEDQRVYFWLLNLSGMTGFIAWLGIAVSHYRFRKGFIAQGHSLSELPYRALFFPWGPLLAFTLCSVVIVGQNYQAFMADSIDWMAVVATYIGIPVFLLLWFGYRLKHKTAFVREQDMCFEGANIAPEATSH